MKATVITLQSVCNYGTQMQAYATQKKLQEYFDEVSFVDYCRKNTIGKGLIDEYAKGSLLRRLAFMPTYWKWQKVFGRFQKKNLNIEGPRVVQGEQDINHSYYLADAYVSGSDQVWNSGWNQGIIPEFFLSFAPDASYKFAYVSSFGKSNLDKEEIVDTQELLQRYNKISVREESALHIVRKQLKIQNATHLLDPTLAYDGDFWRNLKRKNKIKEKYILVYSLNNNPKLDKYAQDLAKKTGYKLYRFCTRYDQIRKTGAPLLIPKIEDFVTYIDDAEIVVTDSFHAIAFSANLNTNFACVFPKKYSSRLKDFLKLINQEDAEIKELDRFDNYERNFLTINKILAEWRPKYDGYLKTILEEMSQNEKSA